jgi:choline monooxygenase
VSARRLEIDEDVARAKTLPAEVYADPAWHATITERVLARAWHLVGDAQDDGAAGTLAPTTLLPGCLDEPLLLASDAHGTLRCLSNVCTHRGNVLVSERGPATGIRCGYHGRRFGLDGRFLSMPRFEGAKDFPSPADDLPRVPAGRLERFLFASLAPSVAFDAWAAPAKALLDAVGASRWRPDPAARRDYDVAANWMLYVDNYLEGFHIPFVHPALAKALDVSAYETRLLPHGTLQVGAASGDGPTLPIAAGSPDAGRRIAAYYLWLFPTTMLNVYPWGCSVNVVRPTGPHTTRVTFLSYVGDERLRAAGAGGDLDGVEHEDEAVVESVQKGVRSRLYTRGRYSPAEEAGVHRFHRLLAAAVADPP